MSREKLLLLLILLFGLVVRIYNISYPPLLWDEASIGYNAYSILRTARDEHGQFLPLIFKSFGDYKPGLYIYLTLPFVAIFGLSPLAVRLPSIILGSLLPLFAYIFTKKYSKNKYLPIIFSAIISFNPYNIHYSRGAWETNILTFELLIASFLFFEKKYLYSSIIFGLTLITYQSGKLASLLLIACLFVTNYSKSFFSKQFFLKFLFPLFIFSLPILYGILFQQQGNRLEVVSLFSYPRNTEEVSLIKSETNNLDYQLLHNDIIFFFRNFFYRYFNHFSPQFLLTQGDWQNPRHSAPYTGVLLFPSVIFLIIGIFKFLSTNYSSKNFSSINLFFFLWLIIAPIPASLTRDDIQATRIMNFSIPLCYFAALGIISTLKLLKKNKFFYLSIKLFIFLSYLLSFISYLDLYHFHMIKKSPQAWLYGYKEAINYALASNDKETLNYFTDFYGQPYIYYLFYSHYSPQQYQLENHFSTDTIDTGKVHQVDNYIFENPNYNHLLLQKNRVLGVFSYDETIVQGIDRQKLTPLSPINSISTFYGYKNF